MQIAINCPKCISHSATIPIEITEGFFEGVDIKCDNGHEFFFICKSPRFQFLLQQGVESFQQNFYFESFHTLYSAYEAYKKEFVAAHIYNKTKNIEICKSVINRLDRSERLEGAFVSAYISLSNGKIPEKLSRSVVELRNNVVHKGQIPSRKDCEKAGNAIFKLIGQANLLIAQRCLSGKDYFPITQVYEYTRTGDILTKHGFKTEVDSPEDFYNRNFIDYQIALNILSTTSLISENDITTHMFSDEIKKEYFLLSEPLTIYQNFIEITIFYKIDFI